MNRKIKRETDGLGRLIKVTEQDVSTGALTQETNYTYDIADRLTLVNQGNQTRTFKYDAEGRLLFERIPEMTATINDGMGSYWTCKYTYTDWGAVATKQDARGVITTYGYDTLHRLISISYNTSGAPGVATTANVTYTYDNSQTSTTKGLLLSISVGTSYWESYNYDTYKRLSATTKVMDGLSYWTGYQYDTANQLTQITYPNGAVINIGHDSKGRLSSVGGYLTNVTYNSIGQTTGATLGNGVTEGYGYDANRMQLTSQTATKSGEPANGLMNLTYGYIATAGQMGAGSTVGNAGQLVTIGGTIGGTTESAAYSYDVVGRLTTSNQASNGSSAQRRFAYDRWGNRTGVWDAVSAGNQIQSITLQQSGGVPTNRIQSVTAGTPVNYSYDSAGNVTNDGTHSYAYDAENRLVSVDAGATALYSYDNQNRRYKKLASGAGTHYIWQGSQVIAEFDSTTRAFIASYVYAGSKMIARQEASAAKYMLSDRLSARLVLDGSGNVIGRMAHLPFGESFGESGNQQKHHLTNYERDAETELDYAINRAYALSIGRFMQADPYRASGYMTNPQSWNRYNYTGNDPINRSDPAGRDWQPGGPSNLGCYWDPNTATIWCPSAQGGVQSNNKDSSLIVDPGRVNPYLPKTDPNSEEKKYDQRNVDRMVNSALEIIEHAAQELQDIIKNNKKDSQSFELSLCQSAIESSLSPSQVGLQGELGLFQLKLSTANGLGLGTFKRKDLFSASLNTQLGTTLLQNLINDFGDVRTALGAYKQGAPSVKRIGLTVSSQEYADAVLQCEEKLKAKKGG